MRLRILFVFLGLTLAGANWVWGQSGHELGGGFQDRLQEVKRSQLGPAVGVNQQIVDKLLEIDQRYKPERHQLIVEMLTERRRLEQTMSQPSPSEQEIKTILSNMKRRKQEMQNLQQRQGDEETAILTPVQQARYLIYQWSLLKEAKSVKGGPGGGVLSSPQQPREIPVSRPPQ